MATHISFFPSPAKKKRSLTDFQKCIICQKLGKDKLLNISESSISTIEKIAGTLCTDTALRLRTDLQSSGEFFAKQPKWHKICQARWLKKRNRASSDQDPPTLSDLAPPNIQPISMVTDQNFQNSMQQDSQHFVVTTHKMQAEVNFNFELLCVVCGKANLAGDKKHEKLSLIEDSQAMINLYNAAKKVQEEGVLRRIQEEGGTPIDICSLKARYHRSCQKSLMNKSRDSFESKADVFSAAFDSLLSEIETPLLSGKCMFASDIRDLYIQLLEKHGLDSETASNYRTSGVKRQLQKHFGDKLVFWPQKGTQSDIVCSSSLTAGQLITALLDLKKDIDESFIPVTDIIESSPSSESNQKVNAWSEMEDFNRRAYNVAQKIKSDLKQTQSSTEKDNSEPLDISYNQAESIIPTSLFNLIAFILDDSVGVESTEENGKVLLEDTQVETNTEVGPTRLSIREKVLNLSQDVAYAKNGLKTPQHVGLAIYIYHKTRSKDIITVLNRLGLCISYNDLHRILTTVALEISAATGDDSTFIPSNIVSGKFTQYAIDNLDFSECTLDGSSMHVTSMVMFQQNGEHDLFQRGGMGHIPVQRDRRTSLPLTDITSNVDKLKNIKKLRRNIAPDKPLTTDWLLEQSHGPKEILNVNLCWAIARLCPTKLLEVDIDCPGWKVLNATISQSSISTTSIGYCPFLRRPPTNPDVVKEALHICMKASAKLGLSHTVVTQDEAVYEISYTLRKNNPVEFPGLILRLGGFHLLMNYLGAVGKFMTGTGLKEMLVKGGVILDGTANKILSGRGYYQSINAHMRAHESMVFLWWYAFEDFCLSQQVDLKRFSDLTENLETLQLGVRADKEQTVHSLKQIQHALQFVEPLMGMFNASRLDFKTHQFWLKYLEMTEIMLLYLHAEREGVWQKHLSAASSMAKIITAADHNKYTKVIVTYLDEMRNLPQTAPEVYEEFDQGNFIVKRSENRFNGIWTDMALECSQNCDAKGRSGQAGLKGITLSAQTQEKWFVTLPFAAAVSGALKSMLQMDNSDNMHHEDTKAIHDREKHSRDVMIDIVNKEMINPFSFSDTNELVNIDNGLRAPENVSQDLLHIEETGHTALAEYLRTGKMCKLGIKTFADVDKTAKVDKSKSRSAVITDELQVLKRALLEKTKSEDNNTLKELLEYEIREYPPSLAEMTTESNAVRLRSGNKSVLLDIMKKRLEIEDWPVNLSESDSKIKTGLVIDVMGLLRTLEPYDEEDTAEFARRTLHGVTSNTSYAEIHLAADRYDGIYGVFYASSQSVSLKDASGCRNRRKETEKQYEISKKNRQSCTKRLSTIV